MVEMPRKTLQEQIVDTDVLIVGAGAGGMMAAISAADAGARVILCEKGNARRSGGLPGGNDHFFCFIPGIHDPVTKENFIRQSLISAEADINIGPADEDLVRKRIDLTYEVLQMWESWGINMKTNGHYEFTGHGWPGTSGKFGEPGKTNRMFLHFSDDKACVKLEKQVRERGVRILNRVMVTELLCDSDGAVVGALGIDTREPIIYIIKARSIVINKGGVTPTRLYPSPNLIGYSMAQPETGDGVMMAYRAGADLQNTELTHRQVSMRFGPWSGKGTWIGVVRDSEGKPIAPPFLAEPDPELGDVSIENADALDNVWRNGKGPVWMDPRGISDKNIQYMRWGFESEAMHPFLRWLDQEKIDIKKTRFEFIAMQPGSGIQARIDANFRTTIKGLYAIFQQNLSGSAVAGLVAGREAAKDIHSYKPTELEKHHNKIKQLKKQYEEILNLGGHQYADWREAQWALWQIMYCYALPSRRTENTLMAGYNQLLRVRELSKRILKANNPHDLYHCLEVLNLMDVAELVLLAVNERKESRGQARRQDYPFTNPLLNKLLVITQKDGKPSFRWENQRRGSNNTMSKEV